MASKGQGAGPGQCPIAIIGMGCTFPGAANLTEFWRTLARGEDGISEVPSTHWSAKDYFDPDPKKPDHTYCTRGGFLSPVLFDPTEFGIPPTILEATDTAQLLSLHVAKAALDDAGYGNDREFNRERVSVILGITGTQELVIPLAARLGHPLWRKALHEAGVTSKIAEQVIQRISDGYVSWQENSFPGLLGNVVAGRIANRLNLRGTNCVIDAACASSLGAVHLAMMELATGRADMVLSGGADALNDIFMYMCFSKTPALSPTGDARPFSADSDGTVLGEGIGILVLKRLEDAERDGDRIYAVIRGMGTSSDGRSQSIYAPHSAGQARCLRNAYRLAGVDPDSVTLIEAHGTGTKVGDATEFEALKTVFREARTDGNWCALGSVKSQIGHTKAAAGAAGLIKTALAIHHRTLPPTIKIKEPNSKLGIEDSPFYLNTELKPWVTTGDTPRRAGVSSFGFGGSNFHAVLEEHHAALPEPAWDRSVQLIALSATSIGGLLDQIDSWLSDMAESRLDQSQLAYRAMLSRQHFSIEHTHRLVVVLELSDDQSVLLRRAKDGLLQMLNPKGWSLAGIEYGCGAQHDQLAFVFPGQGSQYVGMGRRLACLFPDVHQALVDADCAFEGTESPLASAIYPLSAFSDEQRQFQASVLTRTEIAQPAIGALSYGFYKLISSFGLTPDAVCGHSFGELVALCVSGFYDHETLHRLTWLRGRLMAGDGEDRGAMLAVKAPLAEIDRLVSESSLDLVVANRNGPMQGVLSGTRKAISMAADLCKSKGYICRALAVSGAFHSRFMENAVAPFRNAVEAAEFHSGSIPVYGSSNASPYPRDPAGAKAQLSRQLASPVNFVGQIQNMSDAGVRTFVEVGPKAVLTGLIGEILADRPHRALAFDASNGRRCGLADFARLLARLAADGFGVNLAKWEKPVAEPRKPKMVIPLVGANYRAKPQDSGNQSSIASMTPRVDAIQTPALAHSELTNQVTAEAEIMTMDSPKRHAPKKIAGSETSRHPAPFSDEPQVEPPAQRPGNVAPLVPTDPGKPVITEALRLIQDGLRSMQALQQQTAVAHQRFLETQEQAHRAFQQLLESQQRLVMQSVSSPEIQAASRQGTIQDRGVAAGQFQEPAHLRQDPSSSKQATVSVPAPAYMKGSVPDAAKNRPTSALSTANRDSVVSAPSPTPTIDKLERIVLEIVGEKTGYPREMINLEMDIEADLGIDSIKRVEIVAAIEERVPGLSSVKPEHMGGLRSLRQIVEYLAGPGHSVSIGRQGVPQMEVSVLAPSTGAVSVNNTPTQCVTTASSELNADDFSRSMLDVVAQLTGYPLEMLNLEMDMEADLGIDSIKRVEILAGVEARVPNLPPVKPEYMGSLRTLRQIVEYYIAKVPSKVEGEEVAAQAASFRAPSSEIDRPLTIQTPSLGSNDPVQVRLPDTVFSSPRQSSVYRGVVEAHRLPNHSGETAVPTHTGEFWVSDDGTGLSHAIAAHLRQHGIFARIVGLGEIPHLRRESRISGLVIVAPTEIPAADEGQSFLAQALCAAKVLSGDLNTSASTGGAVLATVSRLDGMFGLASDGANPVSGGLAGLVKTAACEWPQVSCRAIDVASLWTEADAMAMAIVRELLGSGPIEVGLRADGRYGLNVVAKPTIAGEPSLETGDVVVITGGARGVTAEAALALARRASPTLILMGRTEVPADEPAWLATLQNEADIKQAILKHEYAGQRPTPAQLQASFQNHLAAREIRHNLERIRVNGSSVVYLTVDVRNDEALNLAVHKVRARYGPIRGIIHGAGVLEDRLIKDKTTEQFARVFDTKVGGLLNLLAAVDTAELRYLVFFSSVSARFGNSGQSDYAMANEVLNKIAQRKSRELPHCRVTSINWGPWDGGMVTPALRREFARRGVDLIPLEAGAEAMVDEMLATERAVEVVLGAPIKQHVSVAEGHSRHIGIHTREDNVSLAFEHELDVGRHPFLRSHVIGGRPVLPLAITLEWLAHAALHANPGLVFHGMENLRVLKAASLDSTTLPLQLAVGRPHRDNGIYAIEVQMRSGSRVMESLRYASGTVLLGSLASPAPAAPEWHDLIDRAYPQTVEVAYEEQLFHGPHFRAIREICGLSDRGIVARVNAATSPREWMAEPLRGNWIADPLMLDAAFQLAILWSREMMGAPSLPSFVARYRQYAPLLSRDGATCVMQVRDAARARIHADVFYIATDGSLVAEMTGFECTVDPLLDSAFRRSGNALTVS